MAQSVSIFSCKYQFFFFPLPISFIRSWISCIAVISNPSDHHILFYSTSRSQLSLPSGMLFAILVILFCLIIVTFLIEWYMNITRVQILPNCLLLTISMKCFFSIVSVLLFNPILYIMFFLCLNSETWNLSVPRGVLYGCGDLIFSSHMIFTLVFVHTYQKYGSNR